MAIQIIKKNQQARGQFNGGEILENKPLGFPREGGYLKPYSNLFYWAHAWSDQGSTIGLHPHQGFEILSFVIDGSIEHFDNKLNKWIKLEKGSAQIIRSGNGISHSEKLNAGAHMFQIWFDPNLDKTLQQDASYNDYPLSAFPTIEKGNLTETIFKGDESPMHMDSPEVEIKRIEIKKGEQHLELDKSKIHSIYLIKGALNIDQESLEGDDFFIVEDYSNLQLQVHEDSTIFVVSSPSNLDYRTYAQRMV